MNPIVELAEKVQSVYGESIITRVMDKQGPDHMPEITVEIELPTGEIFVATGMNKKLAKQEAAIQALNSIGL